MNNFIVKKIKKARTKRGLTQKDLAKHLNRTAASISDLERGKVQVTASDLYKLADCLNKPIEYFFGESYRGKDIDDLVFLIRKMDPEVRSLQIPIIKSLLEMQVKVVDIENEDNDEILKSAASEIYEKLIDYLRNIRLLYNMGLDTKAKLEEIVKTEDVELPSAD